MPMLADLSDSGPGFGTLLLAVLFCVAASAGITVGVYFLVRWWDRRREAKLQLRLKQEAEAAAKAEEEGY